MKAETREQLGELRKLTNRLKSELVEFKRFEKPYSHLADQISIACDMDDLLDKIQENI